MISSFVPFLTKPVRCIVFVLLTLCPVAASAQSRSGPTVSASFPILMLSDLHFDPFHDPSKVPSLARAPVSQWKTILATPDSPEQAGRFASIQETCKAKEGTDTPYTLLRSSLDAARSLAPKTRFVTLSGDLLVHDLGCRYRASMSIPASAVDDQSVSTDFAEKTTVFVMEQVEAAFPKIPIYVALGNNDSRCNHNRLDFHDSYLKSAEGPVLAGLRGANSAEKALAQRTFESAGYYAVTMPGPMRNTRMIVLDDIYMMPAFTTCHATFDREGEREQIEWLQKELDDAQRKMQHVWLLGHLPPSVNADASLSARGSLCTNRRVIRFQDTEELANQISSHADTITLGIFGHTHMDEFHLLKGHSSAVPIKVVASISPVDGNLPSFTVGAVDPASATLAGYTVYEASNATGIETRWSKEYDFNATYQEQGFTSISLERLIARLRDDKGGAGSESRAYQAHFLKGSKGGKLSPSWPGYVCSLENSAAEDFVACVCKAP